MAQWTGTNALSYARVRAQDNDFQGNFAVGAADALVLLNGVLVSWTIHIDTKPVYYSATTTGLTFASGDVSKETDGAPTVNEFESFHSSSSASLTFPVSPALWRVSVPEIQAMLGYDGDTALSPAASEWTHVAAERTQDSDFTSGAERWRVWGYPVINRTRYMVAKAIKNLELSAIGDYINLDEGDARIIGDLLAWEIARLKKENSAQFLESILAQVPRSILDRMYRGGISTNQLQDRVEWVDPW